MTDTLPRIITADEIREGDRIRLTYENGAGDRDHFELTVKRVSTGGVVGASGWSHSTNQDDTITLLDRPEPQPAWEVGQWYRVRLGLVTRILQRTADGWAPDERGNTLYYDRIWPDATATPVTVIDGDHIAIPREVTSRFSATDWRAVAVTVKECPDIYSGDRKGTAALLTALADAIDKEADQ